MAEERTVMAKRVKRSPKEYSEVLRNLGPSHNPLGQFVPWPHDSRVEIQEDDEQILILVRKHWLTNVRWVLIVLVMAIAGMFLSQLPFFGMLPPGFQLMTRFLWYLIAIAVVMEGFLNWYFDVFVITDERIIDIDFNYLIYKNITATKIDRIEDVTYSVSGAVNSLFNFGTILVQTAGEGLRTSPDGAQGTIEMVNTPNPALLAKLINELMLEEEEEKIEGRIN